MCVLTVDFRKGRMHSLAEDIEAEFGTLRSDALAELLTADQQGILETLLQASLGDLPPSVQARFRGRALDAIVRRLRSNVASVSGPERLRLAKGVVFLHMAAWHLGLRR